MGVRCGGRRALGVRLGLGRERAPTHIILENCTSACIHSCTYPARCPRAEPLLAATRRVVPPFNGLDVSPIVWVALLSLVAEVLTGPQGILSLIERKGL